MVVETPIGQCNFAKRIQVFSDVEKPFLFSDLVVVTAVKATRSENDKGFSTLEKAQINLGHALNQKIKKVFQCHRRL